MADETRADIAICGSGFGGGYAFAKSADGRAALENLFFGDDPMPLPQFGGDKGWIIEPKDVEDFAAFVKEQELKVERL